MKVDKIILLVDKNCVFNKLKNLDKYITNPFQTSKITCIIYIYIYTIFVSIYLGTYKKLKIAFFIGFLNLFIIS